MDGSLEHWLEDELSRIYFMELDFIESGMTFVCSKRARVNETRELDVHD